MSDFEQIVIQKLDHLTSLIGMAVPRVRLPRKPPAELINLRLPEGLMRDRVCEAYRIFRMTCELSSAKKTDQKFPVGIREFGMDVVPKALLVNRCAMRKIFKCNPRAGEDSTVDNVKRALDELIKEGKLVQMNLADTEINTESLAVCIFSPEEAKKAMIIPGSVAARKEPERKHSGLHWTPPPKEVQGKPVVPHVDPLSNPDEVDEPFEGFSTKKKIEL